MNIRVHGIRPEDVATAPDWAEQFSDMLDFIGGDVAVAHNAGFDMRVIAAACHQTVLPTPKLRSLCSMQVARKTYDLKSYRLPVAAAAAGFPEFTHHDALADSEAAAAIVLDAARRNEAGTVEVLAKTLGLKLARLKAIPLKL